MITKIITWLLERKKLSPKGRIELLNIVTKNIGITNIDNLIGYDDNGHLTIRGNTLSPEQLIIFKGALESLRSNWARQTIREQMKYEALMIGILADNTDKILFAKAINWLLLKEEELINKLDT